MPDDCGGRQPPNYIRALQYECDDDPSRTWAIIHAGSDLYEIRNRQTRKCLSLSDRKQSRELCLRRRADSTRVRR